jgi:hypothetical protein
MRCVTACSARGLAREMLYADSGEAVFLSTFEEEGSDVVKSYVHRHVRVYHVQVGNGEPCRESVWMFRYWVE